MRCLLRVVVTSMLSLALAAGIGLAPLRATATPVSPAQPAVPRGSVPAPTLNDLPASARADINIGLNIRRKAMNKKKTVLDYKKAKASDGGRTTARRKFAAGYRWMGGKIINISKKELAKVKKYTPKKKAPRDALRGPSQRKVTCTGRTASIAGYYGPAAANIQYIRWWYNSCDTTALINTMDSAAILTGVFTAIAAASGAEPAAIVTGAIAAVFLISKNVVSTWRDNSDVKAVFIFVIGVGFNGGSQ